MNLSVLLGVYGNDSRLKELAAALSLPQPLLRAHLTGLQGAAPAFIGTAVWGLADMNHVFVLTEKEESAYFHNDLEHLTGALDIHYFPDSFKRSGNFSDLNSSHVMLRTEALSKFNGDRVRKKVLVTYPEALFEKVVNPKSLSQNMIQIRSGETIKPDTLMELFVDLGFRREDFVYEPGQFAMRGGILDVYSFGNEHPYRIELFGNEVDSIRIFNPETQLSERKLLSVSILPNVETKFTTGEKISLLEYLPANTVFWFRDLDFCLAKLAQMEEELPERVTLGTIDDDHEEHAQKELTRADFEKSDDWAAMLKKRHLIEWGKGFGGGHSSATAEDPSQEYIHGLGTADPLLYRHLKQFVKDHRSSPTDAEEVLWSRLRGKQINAKFRRQHILGNYIADFVNLEKRLIVEIDGLYHQLPDAADADAVRTEALEKLGFTVIRYSNDEVLQNPEGVVERIESKLKTLRSFREGPLPASPEGGGGVGNGPQRGLDFVAGEDSVEYDARPGERSQHGLSQTGLSQHVTFPLRGKDGMGALGASGPGETSVTIPFNTEIQPSFNRNFELLIADLKKRCGSSCTAYIFAEQAKQLERLRTIFEDTNADVSFVPVPTAISKGFIDNDLNVLCYTDHQIFQRYHKYAVKQAYTKGKAITLKALRELQSGDFVTHIDHGVGVYSGLQKIEVNGNMQEAVRIIYRDNDVLYVNINSLHKISKYTGKEGSPPKVNKLGSDAWEKLKNKTKKQVKDIAADLIRLYAKRKASKGFAHTPDTYLQTELEASFFYEDTPDQAKATADVKRDMEAENPMDRLVCGDVGFGKTEIAVRAAFKTVVDGKQAAVLVPTTILAYQHYQTFKERLKDFPCTVDYVNRFKSAKEKKETMQRLEDGKVDIIIGTHGLLGKDVKFKDLGVLIIDEEQKFGVAAKEKLRERKAAVDTLTLTATPIPRTLQFSLMSARDLSIINTPPPNRQPVHTEVMVFDEEFIRDALYHETNRGGQVYFVHNRVQSLPDMMGKLKALCPDLSFVMAHGQMEGHKLEQALADFISYKYDVLVCTNIVESGVDISNANTIIINNAHNYGLSDLHQLRGRVGRSNKKAFCYLIAPPYITLPDDSRKRLQTLEQFSELGSGFQIAMRDLDIRGAGNLLGGEQSGFITDMGFEMYQKILAEAMRELKTTDFKDVFADELDRKKDFVADCTIDTDQEILIPDSYVENITERLSLYTQLDDLERPEDIGAFREMLIDRFGPMPPQVEDLFTALRCRHVAKDLGFEKLILKNGALRLYFISNPESPYFESDTFKRIMQHIQTSATHKARLKQVGMNFMLLADGFKGIGEVMWFLEGMG